MFLYIEDLSLLCVKCIFEHFYFESQLQAKSKLYSVFPGAISMDNHLSHYLILSKVGTSAFKDGLYHAGIFPNGRTQFSNHFSWVMIYVC